MIDKSTFGRGISYLYIESITMLFSGYIYWLILSKITSPLVIGTSSTVISIAGIFTVIGALGVSGGIQRYLSKAMVSKDSRMIKGLINSAFLLVSVGMAVTLSFILLCSSWLADIFRLDPVLIIISAVLVSLNVVSNLLRYIIIASIKTKSITLSSLLATIIKLIVTVGLILLGYELYGILIGFILYYIVSTFVLIIPIRTSIYVKNIRVKVLKREFIKYKEILISSIPFWIPNILNVAGSQLGTIAVYISNGADNAGVYYIAMSIFTGTSIIITVLTTISYPTVGSMNDGKKRAVWKLIRLSLVVTMPVSILIIYSSPYILQFFGPNYLIGSSVLQILFLSVLPSSLSAGIGVLFYSQENNHKFLIIGLSSSIPRIVLYFPIIDAYGLEGAAIAYLFGSIMGGSAAIVFASRDRFKIYWKQIFYTILIPTSIIIPFYLIDINPLLTIMTTTILTYVIFLRLKIIELQDIEDISLLLPKVIAGPFRMFTFKISKSLDPTK
jgi:O-antigen/teichoic acid export membrane protein